MMRRLLLSFLALLLAMSGVDQTLAQGTGFSSTATSSTTFAGPVSAGAAGSVLQNGWTALSANVWSINSSNYASSVSVSNPWNVGMLVRPASEDSLDSKTVLQFRYNTVTQNLWIACRHNRSTTAATAYIASYDASLVAIHIDKVVGGVLSSLGYVAATTVSAGTDYKLELDCVQTNATTTTITATASTLGGSADVGTYTVTDTTTTLQGVAGSVGLFVSGATGASSVANAYTYQDTAATSYTLSGPSYGPTSTPSGKFCVLPNGAVPAATTYALSDSSHGGTFSPTSLSIYAACFTYSNATAGTYSLATTNNQSLANPSAASYSVAPPITFAINSTAIKLSPANWKTNGSTGRGGASWAQSWNNGAWIDITWAASSSPTATLLLNSSASSNMMSYFLNGVLTDNVPASANISLSGIIPNASNEVRFYLRNSTQVSRWNNGSNTVQVTGFQIDGFSAAGVAPPYQPWILSWEDSIGEGIQANAQADDYLDDYNFLVSRGFDAQGYDWAQSACGFSSWIHVGDSTGDVPGLYVVSGSSGGVGGTYSDSASRWNKIDAGVSLLDSNGHISAYGATGQEPYAIKINYGTNSSIYTDNLSDTQASVTQGLTAFRAAAPNAWIFVIIPFGLYNTIVFPNTGYVAAIKAGVSALNDSKIRVIDFGAQFSTTISSAPWTTTGKVHPLFAGHALISPMISAPMSAAMNSAPVTFAGGFHP